MKSLLLSAAIIAMLAVILGAFGAHSLKAHLSDSQLASFETGVRYQFYHSFGIFVAAILFGLYTVPQLKTAGWVFLVGIVLFSGSLYLLSCRDLLGIASWKWLGPVTPIGGLAFIIGWGLLAYGVTRIAP